MSCVVVLAPVVVAAWPVVASAVVAAAVAAGFKVAKAKPAQRASRTSVDLTLENADAVAESMNPDDRIVVERQGVTVVFSRDARGRFQVCVEGDLSKKELQAIGQDLAGRVVQQYVYQRLSQELGQNGFTTLSEEKGPDESIRLHVRRYEG